MVGRIDDTLRQAIEEMLFAVYSQDSALLTSLIKRDGKIPPAIDEAMLSNDVADLIATYSSQPIESIDLAMALNDATDILHRHRNHATKSNGIANQDLGHSTGNHSRAIHWI